MNYSKKNVLLLVLITCISCSKNVEKCSSIFTKNNSDSSLFYVGEAFIYKKQCVQKFKINAVSAEYGKSLIMEDTCLLYKKDNQLYLLEKNNASFNNSISLFDENSEIKPIEHFYDSQLKDTVYRITTDAKIGNTENTNINLVLLVAKDNGFQGMYIQDASDYILNKYKKAVIRSVKGNAYLTNIDTSNTIIYTGAMEGVY